MTTLIRLEDNTGYLCFENGSRIAWDIDPVVASMLTPHSWIIADEWRPYEPEPPIFKVHSHVIYVESKSKK
jgi:hypothetical protein